MLEVAVQDTCEGRRVCVSGRPLLREELPGGLNGGYKLRITPEMWRVYVDYQTRGGGKSWAISKRPYALALAEQVSREEHRKVSLFCVTDAKGKKPHLDIILRGWHYRVTVLDRKPWRAVRKLDQAIREAHWAGTPVQAVLDTIKDDILLPVSVRLYEYGDGDWRE